MIPKIFQGELWNMLVSTAGECCFVGYAGQKSHCIFLCSSFLPPSLPDPFSVVLGDFPPLFVLVLLYHPFPLLTLSSLLLYFILSIQFLTLLLCSSFSQCRCGLGISNCGWWVSSVLRHCVPLGHLPQCSWWVCVGRLTMGMGDRSAACLLGES